MLCVWCCVVIRVPFSSGRSPPGLAKTPLSALGLKPHNPAEILLNQTGSGWLYCNTHFVRMTTFGGHSDMERIIRQELNLSCYCFLMLLMFVYISIFCRTGLYWKYDQLRNTKMQWNLYGQKLLIGIWVGLIFKPFHLAASVPTQQAYQPLTFLRIHSLCVCNWRLNGNTSQ